MKENMRKCIKCGRSPATEPATTLYRFPKPGLKNSLRCELWAKYCYPDAAWSTRNFQEKLHKDHRMLCNHHFKASLFVNKKLVRSAAPDMPCDEMTSPVIIELSAVNLSPSEPLRDNKSLNISFANATAGPSHATPGPSQSTPGPSQLKPEPSQSTPRPSQLKPEPSQSTPGPSQQKPEPSQSTPGPSQLKPEPSQKTQELEETHKKIIILQKKERYLYMKCRKQIQNVCKLEKSMKRLKSEAFMNAFIKDECIDTLLKSKLTPSFALLLQGQIKNFKKKSKGRRWNTESKIIALRLYKRSPTCYKLLRRLICLPTPSTLKTLLNNLKLDTGINQQIFSVMKKTLIYQKSSEKEYILMFDEMSIKKNITYNSKKDLIEGFQDHAEQGRTRQVASHALVFMVAGIRKKVKQPVAYYLSSGSVTGDRLAVLIKQVLRSCFDAGITIAATVCDMDGVNKRALGILGATSEKPCITIFEQEVVTLFDSPHLLKCFRNNFLKHDIKCAIDISSNEKQGIGIAKWSHIEFFYEMDNNNPNFVFAPTLRKDHLSPNTKQKMKVKLAAQVLSHTVAAGIFAKIAQGELTTEAATTANVLSNMDKLFDSLNAVSPDLRRGKPYATNLKKGSPHFEHFKKMTSFFKNLEFIGCRRPPPFLDGFIWTLNGVEEIWKSLRRKHKDVKSLATRRLQQDPLENLFGCIRGHCGSNTNPTAGQFVAGLKTAMLANLPQVSIGNCEIDDNDTILNSYKTLLTSTTDNTSTSGPNNMSDIEVTPINTDCEEIELTAEIQACAYVCGFIVKNHHTKCIGCKKAFTSEVNEIHNFIAFKEYSDTKKALVYPSTELTMCVEKCATLINHTLKNEAHHCNIKKKIVDLLKQSIKFEFLNNCITHRGSNMIYIIESVFHICVKRFCIIENRRFSDESSAAALKRKLDIMKHK